jgi:NAD(P)-dependent dehydrogenase (short-subunit alcohol dehydrogenase family)
VALKEEALSVSLFKEDALRGTTAVVTGGSRGLGREMVLALARAGASVYAGGRTAEAVKQTIELASDASGSVEALTFDVTDGRAIDAAADEAVERAGSIDVLINSAGVALMEPSLTVTDDQWAQVIDINLTGVFYCCRAFGRHMVAAKKGRIINIASDIGLRGLGQWTAYSASKGGVISLTKSLAWEWAPDVTVNALAPGAFLTDMNAPLREGRPGHTELVAESAALKRWGVPPEIGPVTVLMASGAMDFMTGSVVSIDGGTQQ